jgi:type II secretory pathway component GspD/PulD (secretin)
MTQAVRGVWWQILVAFSVCLMAAGAIAQSLEIIDLKHRSAQELMPALQPLVAPGGSLSGQDYKLFVRTTSQNLADLRRVIAQLDKAPRTLLVSVRNATRQQIEQEGASISGTLSTDGGRARMDANAGSSQRTGEGVASVAVLEGNSAMINNGSSIPIVTAVVARGGRRPLIGAQTEYRDLVNGFVVTPRVSGDRVVLDISQRAESLRNGVIDNQELQTQASARLGEWLSLGGVSESSTSSERGIGSRQYSTRSDNRSLWIKVELQ